VSPRRKSAAIASEKNGNGRATAAAAPPALEGAGDERTPFEAFAIDFLRARGSAAVERAPLEWDVTLPADMARRWRRPSLRLVFDSSRVTLPHGAAFAAPGSQMGLKLMKEAREGGHVARFHAVPRAHVDARAIAGEGLVLHDVDAGTPVLGTPGHVVEVGFHATLTFQGGSPEQDLRSILVDPRGPSFDFWEAEDRRRAGLVDGFPADFEAPAFDRAALWQAARAWLERVLEPRAARWAKKADENRERDLARLNAFYQTRIQEERDRRRRRRTDDAENEEPSTEAALKLEWGRRTKAVRARYESAIEVRLWGIEEIARPRQAVTYPLSLAGKPVARFEVEVDLATGTLVRPPCPLCQRPAGEFWWEGEQLVCRRCRGRARAGGSRARKGR
jgi:hypothetical protein